MKEVQKSLRDYVEKCISKSWGILPCNEFCSVWHNIILKLDEVDLVFVCAGKKNPKSIYALFHALKL